MAAVAGAGLLLFAAAGCATAPEPVQTSTVPTAAPVFASDEEALAAATEAYANYVAVADQIVREGGADPSRISEFVSDDLAKSEISSFDSLADRSLRGVGESSYSNFSLQKVSDESSGEDVVMAYVCSDLSGTDVLNETGESVVSPDRQVRKPYQVTFDVSQNDSQKLVVSSVTVWDGSGVCQ